MSRQQVSDEQRAAIEVTIRVLTDELVAASEQVDVDRVFAKCSDAHDAGFIDNGVFYPSLDSLLAAFRTGFSRLRRQEIEVSETRVSVLAPNVAVLTAHGYGTATQTDDQTFESPFAWTFVFVKEGDNWRIVHSHQSFPLPEGSTRH